MDSELNIESSSLLESEEHKAHGEHITSYKTFFYILLVLLSLTILTVVVAQTDFGQWHALHIWVALIIASVKACFVLWIFMHLKHEPNFIRYSLLSTVVFLVIMISFIFLDVAFRTLNP